MTPSTTLSNKSSEERVSIGDSNETNAYMMGRGLKEQESLQLWNAPPTRPSGYQEIYTSAPKRTANGEIKSPQYSLPTSPVESSQYGHSRNSSMTSRGSQIGEVRFQYFLTQFRIWQLTAENSSCPLNSKHGSHMLWSKSSMVGSPTTLTTSSI